MIKRLRATFRLLYFAGFLVAIILYVQWLRWWSGVDMTRFLLIRQRWTRNHLLPTLGVRMQVEGTPPDFPCIVMCSHRSYIDPAVICRDVLGFPVSKAEVSHWPLLGKGAKLTGILFVKRESDTSRRNTLQAIGEKVQEGYPVILFPEGTTHDMPHTSALAPGGFFLAAREDLPIVPVALEFSTAKDYWIGSDTFVPHFLERFGEKHMDVRVRYGPTLRDNDGEALLKATQSWMDAQIPELRRNFFE
ncbi:MAG: 1-acyl-sn-glycerol-3-phosphate acyltransferase [Bacteroidetes bacterium]|nr:MAG: 1-acyl-sn-glycerol-3-phosphate acyltransferase [Bacteroidota bacterium]